MQFSTFSSSDKVLFTWRKRGGQSGRCSLVAATFIILLHVGEVPPCMNPHWLVVFTKARPTAGRFAQPLDLPSSRQGAVRATVDAWVHFSSATPSAHVGKNPGKLKRRTRSFLKSFNLGIICLD